MKKILPILTASVVILLFLPVNLEAQEVKTEKKIKIIIDEGSGKKVIIDTVITDNSDIETIKTADGKIIRISSDSKDLEAKGAGTHLEKSYNVIVTSDDEATVEKTRYVVAKDGMVVTVEGEDEAKARELMKVIEEHLGVKDKGVEKEGKSETKNSSGK